MPTLTRPKRMDTSVGGWRRRIVGPLLMGAVVSAGIAIGVSVAADPGAPEALPTQTPIAGASGTGATDAAAVDWLEVVSALDVARDLAIRNGDAAAVADYAVAGSPAASADEQLLRQVEAASLRPSPVLPEVSDVEVLEAGADQVRVRVVDQLSAVDWIGSDGMAAATQEARQQRGWLISLRPVDGRWLLWEVSAEAVGAR